MAEVRSKWPFAPTDGGPESRPRVVDLDNVLIAMVSDAAGAEQMLRDLGFTDERMRVYPSELILEYDRQFRSGRGILDRAVGTIVDDNAAMTEYVDYAREGGSAVWVHVADRDDANRIIRHLVEHGLLHAWFHGHGGVEIVHVR